MKYRYPLIAAVAICAAAAGFFAGQKTPPETQPAAISAQIAEKLLQTPLSTPEGKAAPLKQWEGKILVINFWATWCPPCREEMPEFSRAQEKLADKGVQFVGIGIDTPDNITSFKKAHRVSYPLLMGSYDTLKLSAELGNTSSALPFTVILDRQGQVTHTKMGKLDEAELDRLLRPLYTAAAQ